MNNSLYKKLSSLGCNFAVQEDDFVADPELTILEALDSFWEDKKIFTMLTALLKYRLHQLINTKRLYLLSKNIDNDRKKLLKVLVIKIGRQTGDNRFIELAGKLKIQKACKFSIPKKYQDTFYIQRKGIDKDFKKVGLRVAGFFDDQPERKLKPLKKIYKENLWLKLRAIAGPDYRADTLYLKRAGRADTQAEVVKILKCNKSSISRIWLSFKNIEDLADVI